MKKLILPLVLFFIQPAMAENTEVLKCRVANADWQSVFIIDSLGGGIMKFQKSGDTNFYACSMKLTSFSDMRNGVVPEVRATMALGACDPDISRYKNKLLNTVYLQVSVSGNSAKEASVQWLQDKQPENCVVEKIKLDDMHEYSVKWSKGQWGRRPASSPDKLKKKF